MMKKSGRGAVGRARSQRQRYATDEKYRNKRNELKKNWRMKNKEREKERAKQYSKQLSEFRNRKCKECNKLLHFKTKGDYCRKHIWIGRKEK